MTNSITRRTALKAAPAVALTAAVPAMALAGPESPLATQGDLLLSGTTPEGFRERLRYTAAALEIPESEIMRLFREWERFYADDYHRDDDDEADHVGPIEAKIAALTPTSAQDYARKIIVWTIYGTEINGCHMDDAIVAEMIALAGVTVPKGVAQSA